MHTYHISRHAHVLDTGNTDLNPPECCATSTQLFRQLPKITALAALETDGLHGRASAQQKITSGRSWQVSVKTFGMKPGV